MAPVPVTSATHELVLGQHFAAHDPEVDALDDIQLLWDVGFATRMSRAREESDALMAERSQELDTKPHAPPVCGLLDARIRELERDQGWIGVMNNLGLEHRADGKLADGDTLVVMNFPEPFAPWPADPPFVRVSLPLVLLSGNFVGKHGRLTCQLQVRWLPVAIGQIPCPF